MEHRLPKGTVLIAGGGPIGLVTARVLAHYDVPSILFERNATTTDWPKMDLTNARSMELFRMIGLADELRAQGVPPQYDQDVLISTGMSADSILSKWDLPGVAKFRERIAKCEDGSMPLEPYQRLSQAVFERWLKGVCEKEPLVELRYGWRVDGVEEEGECVRTTVVEVATGKTEVFVSDYVAGCDGASSRVRKSFDIPVDGGPIPACAHLVHFKSRDLTRLHKHGRFWHIFFADPVGGLGGAIIAQDEVDTWTTHMFIPLDFDPTTMKAEEVVAKVLGGMREPYPVEIDQILVRSTWRPHISVTRRWNSPGLRCFLAGDAAHLNIPTGGYGMNMGIADAFDLGWKLASVIHGHGGKRLLESYELERKPVAEANVQRSGVHFNVHLQLKEFLDGDNAKRVDEDSEEARELRKAIHEYYQEHDNENKDFGVEMGYRYRSPIVVPDETSKPEPPSDPSRYVPTTWPGGRPPHVFLSDGTPIFERFGKYWTLLVFTKQDHGHDEIVEAAKILEIPLKVVDLSDEELAKKLYEANLVLIRPDQHVAWRAEGVKDQENGRRTMATVSG